MKEVFDMVVLMHSIDKNAMSNVGRYIDDGVIKRVEDEILKGAAIELTGNISDNNFIVFPEQIEQAIDASSNMKFLNMTIKNIDKVF
jgi:hypothetical protein